MILELYSVPGDENGRMIKRFLEKNNLLFKEIVTNDIRMLRRVAQENLQERISLLKVRYRHAIQVMVGFNQHMLNQLIEHIERYKPRIET